MTDNKFKKLNIRDTIYLTKYTKKFENRKVWKKPNPNEIISFLPGTILAMYIQEGQEVKQGETLYKFEAMKMENIVIAPHDGIVKSINIKVGDSFPKGNLLIELM